ncbi:MAG: TonB-dependent receptor, partial [Mucilaginibacter polytrichastri]|nr:TonB-dependent receptor [Mucilaginibacter polytrichastri]
MKYIFYALALFIGAIHPSYAQTKRGGTVSGTITTTDSEPAVGVSVMIRGTSLGTTTNQNGTYTLKNIRPGKHILVISGISISRQEKEFSVNAGESVAVNFTLSLSSQNLQEITVAAEKTNKFKRKSSDMVARMPLKDLENPQVYSTVGKELIQEQVITNFDDVLKNAPGLNKLWSSTGRAGDGAAYYSLRGFSVQPTLLNGVAGVSNGTLDPANVEKIEVVKGPSGTLFGGALVNFGGLINVVTKKPTDSLSGEISYTGGTYNLNRVTVDFNSPLNKEKTVLFRLNGAYHYEQSFQDNGFRKSIFVAPSLEYRASDKLTFNLNTEFFQGEGTNPLFVFLNRTRQLIARTPAQLNMNFNRSYTSNDITLKNPSANIYAQATYKISDQWTSQTNVARSIRRSEGYNQYVMFIGATDTLLNRYAQMQNSVGNTTDIQQNFTGDFHIGSLRNRLVVGVDYLNTSLVNNNMSTLLFDQIGTQRNDPRYTAINKLALDARSATGTAAQKTNTVTNVYSAYASNVLNITDNLLAMASLRVDRFNNKGTYNYTTTLNTGTYLQTAFSPKFGLVYQIIKDKVSVFGNYMNGFRNVAPVTQPLPDIPGTFKPQQANQIEGGVKLSFLHDKISFNASYYDITVSNL